MTRLYNLDYLRGVAAFGIMIYHYSSWSIGRYSSDTFLGRLGIYGVSIFYILSGLTLFHVYHTRMAPTKNQILSFFKKRIFRIYPLLWLATFISIFTTHSFTGASGLLLDLSGLFGFFRWDEHIATGAWSIGNEIVFYLFIPIFFVLLNRSKIAFVLFTLLISFIFLYFAFYILDERSPLTSQWRNYVNPLNQLFFFLGGFIVGYLLQNKRLNTRIGVVLLVAGLSLFCLYPAHGNTINIVTGVNRIVFTLACFLICISVFKINFKFSKIIDQPLSMLGEASYSVYLLHPIVFSIIRRASSVVSKRLIVIPIEVTFVLSITVTLVSSYFVYVKYEKYFMKLGRRDSSSRFSTRPEILDKNADIREGDIKDGLLENNVATQV